MQRRLLVTALMGTVFVGALSGCGEEETAEEKLMSALKEIDEENKKKNASLRDEAYKMKPLKPFVVDFKADAEKARQERQQRQQQK